MCTVQIYLFGGEQGAAQYMVEFLRGQVHVHDVKLLLPFCFPSASFLWFSFLIILRAFRSLSDFFVCSGHMIRRRPLLYSA